MKQKTVTLQIAVSLLGTIIGAGIFGLPAVFSRTGILGGTLIFTAILLIVVILNNLYIDVIYAVRGNHRLPGYVEKIYGRKAYWVAITSMLAKIAGTLLAYVILGGTFLHMLALGLHWNYPSWFWTIIFWGVGSLIVFYGVNAVCKIQGELTLLLIGFMLFTGLILFPFINWSSIAHISIDGFVGSIGIIFFSVSALAVLPDLKDIALKEQNQFRIGATWATLGAGALSWIFGVVIASVHPHVNSVADIQKAFPQIFWWLIPLIGLLAVGTSFLTFTQAFKNLLHVDLKIRRTPAWIIAVVAPIMLFALVSQDFLKTIGFVGGVVTAFNGLLICFMAYKINQRKGSALWLNHINGSSQKSSRAYLNVWRKVPVPVAIVLTLIIIEHLITTFHL